MKKMILLAAAWLAGAGAYAQLNVDITTGFDSTTNALTTPGLPDDDWEWWNGTSYVNPLITNGYDSWGILHFPAPSNGCGEWTSPYVQGSGNTYNGNPANSSQVHQYRFIFNNPATCPLTNARIELNAVGADDFIYFKLKNGIYTINPTLSNCGGAPQTNIAVQYNLTVTLNPGDIPPGIDTLYAYVCSDYKWTGFLLCGSLKADFAADPNLVPSITGPSTFCSGWNINVTGSSGTTNVTNHYWEVAECSSTGVITPGGYFWSNWYPGAPTGSFPIPNGNTLACGKYYKIKLALQNACTPWVETNKIIYINCSPTPVISGPSTLCYGVPGTYSIGTQPRGTTILWSTGATTNTISFTPTATTTLSVTVTNITGCSGTASYTVNVLNTNPDFNVTWNFNSPYTYYTCSATPVVTSALPPGFGFAWYVVELDASNNPITGTNVNNPSAWWSSLSTNFCGYDGFNNSSYNGTGTLNCTATPVGLFVAGHRYRITRGTWSTDCGYQQVSKVVYICNNCRGASPLVVENDPNAPSMESYFRGQSIPAENNFTIAPNPGNGECTILLDQAISEGTVEIYSMTGEKVAVYAIRNSNSVAVHATDLAKGIYLVKVSDGKSVICQRMIIE